MRLQIFSDLHLDVSPSRRPAFEIADLSTCDATVIAGDVCEGMHHAVAWMVDKGLTAKPILYVLGNHEFYRGSVDYELRTARELARSIPNLHILENSSVVLGNTRFIGATLWTDYELDGVEGREAAMALAARQISDHQVIRIGGKEKFLPKHAAALHAQSRGYIEGQLRLAHAGPTVVISHHAPSRRSISPQYAVSALNPAFASNLDDLLCGADLWVHGHIHTTRDYQDGKCRVVCNPFGYIGETTGYVRGLVIDVAPKKQGRRKKAA